MLVGVSARVNRAVAEKIEAAFAQAKVRAVHVPDVAVACERVGTSMPQVVVVMGQPDAQSEGRLADCAEAVGAAVIYIDPALDDVTLEETINAAVDTAIHRKLLQEERARSPHVESGGPGQTEIPVALEGDDVDEGW